MGHNYLGTFFAASDALLAPGGVMVMQAITTPEHRYEEYIRSTDFINTIIFPGESEGSGATHRRAAVAPAITTRRRAVLVYRVLTWKSTAFLDVVDPTSTHHGWSPTRIPRYQSVPKYWDRLCVHPCRTAKLVPHYVIQFFPPPKNCGPVLKWLKFNPTILVFRGFAVAHACAFMLSFCWRNFKGGHNNSASC